MDTNVRNRMILSKLFAILLITAIVGGRLLAWTFTKSGKKWLANL